MDSTALALEPMPNVTRAYYTYLHVPWKMFTPCNLPFSNLQDMFDSHICTANLTCSGPKSFPLPSLDLECLTTLAAFRFVCDLQELYVF